MEGRIKERRSGTEAVRWDEVCSHNFLTTLIRVLLQGIQSIILRKFMKGYSKKNVSVATSCLTDSNFDPNELRDSGRSDWLDQRSQSTGFIEACSNGHTEIVRLLLKDSRIDVNKADNHGKTGFIYACLKGQREIQYSSVIATLGYSNLGYS